ncbi:AGE family epimerase/isomerase [Phenylobacterium montanum]|uniref:AGE family epimerase/isomerase n=1 Tax=Phenylobacterium montanum TaxID=2823693 RepID=A0A975FWZ0_9CAUL|nr:AGE family epimerase/isomerase [Caulobacter sp. S6]QUD87013.1 AGE family epimerase/isomerase [Caulobacter sp. S6]
MTTIDRQSPSARTAVAPRFDDVRRWAFERALPFWSTVGRDGDQGFVEHLTLEGVPADVGYKRLRVQARQIYVYSHASMLGYADGLVAAENGWRFMLRHGWLADGGWARRLGREGGVVDPTVDLYDQAFALFAIAWWVRASGDVAAIGWADRTLAAIDAHLARSDGRGWHAEAPHPAEAVQNPHMHMVEALLALYETTGAERFAAKAIEIADLMRSTFFDAKTSTLAEYFDQNWRRQPGERGRIIEPGHQFEWAWILRHLTRLTGADFADTAHGLFAFAEAHGVDPASGLTWDGVLDDGSPCDRTSRSWPQTEALKAHLAEIEFNGRPLDGRPARIVANLLDRFLDRPVPGAWVDHLDERGAVITDKVPASTLYHVFLAFSELLRLEPTLNAQLNQTA